MVIEKLRDLEKGQERYFEDMIDLKVAIAQLQVRAGIWGAVAGLVMAIGALVFTLATGHSPVVTGPLPPGPH